jgi:hypothetical protein
MPKIPFTMEATPKNGEYKDQLIYIKIENGEIEVFGPNGEPIENVYELNFRVGGCRAKPVVSITYGVDTLDWGT